MREIKFRAWNEEKKKYFRYNENSDIVYFDLNDKDNGYFGDVITGNYILEQFTGLHDKNGKEIYEGDVIGSGVIKYDIIDIEVHDGGIHIQEKYCGFYIESKYGHKYLLSTIYGESPEIVGNIHANC